MLTPGYRWFVGDLRNGGPMRSVSPKGLRWSKNIAGDVTLEASHPLAGGEWDDAWESAVPAKSAMALAYVDARGERHYLAGGPIWTCDFTDDQAQILKVSGSSVYSYYDHRLVVPVLEASQSPAGVILDLNGPQLGSVAKHLVEVAHLHTNGSLPIVLPDDTEFDGDDWVQRLYPGEDLATVGERLRQLTEDEDGPEIQFVPREHPDDPRYIQWVMRIGKRQDRGLLAQSGPDWEFDRSVPESMVKSISVTRAGGRMATRSWAAAQGDSLSRLIASASDPTLENAGWPLLEATVQSMDSVNDLAMLRSRARADVVANGRPIETWTVVVARDGSPNVSQYEVGDWALVNVQGHRYIPDGERRMRIVGVGGDAGEFVNLSMAPRLGGL